jgi:hypothetical protein
MSTLVCMDSRLLAQRRFFHGEEIPPRLLVGEELGQWLDRGWCVECDRRSLYRMLGAFHSYPIAPGEVEPPPLSFYTLVD